MTNFHASRMRRCLLAAAVAQALIALPAMAQSTSPNQDLGEKKQTDTSAPVELKEVVVTAQRRKQNIQKVPIAVTAIDEADLDKRGIQNISDLSGAAPSMVIVASPGAAASVAVSIRGTYRPNPAPYWDTPVGMYMDGVYIGKTAGNVFDLLNLQRVEVLRGPQGTLFGRNTMAGAVNLVTNPPSGQFTGQASLGFGNYGSKVARVITDLPAMGKLKVSVGARYEDRDGWVKTTPGSSEPDLASRHNSEAFASLEFDATDNLKLNYRFDYSKTDQQGLFNQAIQSDVYQNFGIPGIIVNPTRQTTASIDSPNHEFAKVEGNALTATWTLGDAGTLKYIGAYREMHNTYSLDLDGSPIPFAQSLSASRYHQLSNELQYLGSIGPWTWAAGLYSFDDNGYTRGPQSYFFGAVNYATNEYGYSTNSRAAYAQVDYKWSDKLTITAGWRRTLDDKTGSRFQALGGANPVVLIPDGTKGKTSAGASTPMLALTYQLTPSNMIYFRYAEGFLGGGFNGDAQSTISAITPFKPEYQKTSEVGSKNLFFDNRLAITADVFYNHTTDLQVQQFIATGSAGSVVVNQGVSNTHGFELEAHLRATKNLTLGVNYGYLAGFGGAPHNTGNFNLDATLARTSMGILHTTWDYRIISKYTGTTDNSHIPVNRTINGQVAFGEINLGSTVTGEVALYVKNLTNEAAINSIVDFGANFGNLKFANFQEPRTFGVNFTARW